MGFELFFSLLINWIIIKLGYSPLLFYTVLFIYTLYRNGFKLRAIPLVLALYPLIGFLFKLDYAGEIFVCSLFISQKMPTIGLKSLNVVALIIFSIGFLEFTSIIPAGLLQTGETDYFKISTLLLNPYFNGVFTVLVLYRNAAANKWLMAFVCLVFLFLLGNRALIFTGMFLFALISYDKLPKAVFAAAFLAFTAVLVIGYRYSKEVVAWESFDDPVNRFYAGFGQFETNNSTVLLTPAFLIDSEVNLLGFEKLASDHWIRDFSVSDVMFSYLVTSFGIIYILIYLILFYNAALGEKDINKLHRYTLLTFFILISINDVGIFVPLTVYLTLKIL